MTELDDVEENYLEQMNYSRFNSSGLGSCLEWTHERSASSKEVFLQLFQLMTKTAVQTIEPVRSSSRDTTFASHVEMSDAVPVQWNFEKESSLVSVMEDHGEPFLSSTKVENYSDIITYFDAITPSSIQTFSDHHCCSDVLSCSDVLNSSDDLSYTSGSTGSNSFDGLEQHNMQNCHFGLRHRNYLFAVDICSLVGQRYIQFQNICSRFNPDDTMSYDLYCQWPMIEDTSRWLRPRPEPYPVTFKKEIDPSLFTHLYKFTRAEQIEFARKVGHWLSRRSRKLQRQMKPCSVPLVRLPVNTLMKYLRCQPVVCLASLSKSTIKKLTSKARVINSSNRKLPKHHKRSVCRVSCASFVGRPFVLLTHCDLKSTKMGKFVDQPQAERYPLSCLNQSGEMISMRCSSLAVTGCSYGTSNFSDSSLLCKNLLTNPIVSLEEVSSAMTRHQLSSSVSTRTYASSHCQKSPSLGLRMNQSTLNMMAGNCKVLLRDLHVGRRHTEKRNPGAELVEKERKMQKMKTDQCFVTLTDCSRKNSVPIANTRRVQLKRHMHSDPGWIYVKENHSTLTKSELTVKRVKSFMANNNGAVLKQNRNNVI